MKGHKEEEHESLMVKELEEGGGRTGGRGRGRGRGSQSNNKEFVECYKCHKLGNFPYEYPNWGKMQILLNLMRRKKCC